MADEAVFPVWCYVDRLEQSGEISELEARRWIFTSRAKRSAYVSSTLPLFPDALWMNFLDAVRSLLPALIKAA